MSEEIKVDNGRRLLAELPDYNGPVGVVEQPDGSVIISYCPSGGAPVDVGFGMCVGDREMYVTEIKRSDYVANMVVLTLRP